MKKTGVPYAKWDDDGAYDVIVIGSGIGGLAVAAQECNTSVRSTEKTR